MVFMLSLPQISTCTKTQGLPLQLKLRYGDFASDLNIYDELLRDPMIGGGKGGVFDFTIEGSWACQTTYHTCGALVFG